MLFYSLYAWDLATSTGKREIRSVYGRLPYSKELRVQYSTKNVPLAGKNAYVQALIAKTEYALESLLLSQQEFKTNAHSKSLQKKLSKDVKEVREEKNFFVKADKTTNYYKTEPRVDYMYVTLVNKNV